VSRAGWFNDDVDPTIARWHDGEQWTEHTLLKGLWTSAHPPPPPGERPPTPWVPAYRQALPTRGPSLAHRLRRRFLDWPRWARIATPVVATLLPISAVGTVAMDSGHPQHTDSGAQTQPAPEDPKVDVVEVEEPPSPLDALVDELCDESPDAAAALEAISTDPEEQLAALKAATEAAREACPDTNAAAPQLGDDAP
jgi:hypothetical protein